MSYDDQFLFSVGLDGSLFSFRVVDKEGRGLKREKDITFSEEVLVTKSDLEEKVNLLPYYHFYNKELIVKFCMNAALNTRQQITFLNFLNIS